MPGGVEPSNLDKVLWPDDGITKGDLIAYVDAMAPYLLRELRGRPLTVIRYPDGIGRFSFYQKDTPKYAPGWVRTISIHAGSAKRDVRYTVCNSKRTLLWLANQAAIELHPWLSRVDRLSNPTHLVLDIDPPEGDFARAVEAAFLVRDALAGIGLTALTKTSGAKGIHVFVPLQRRHDFDRVRASAVAIAAMVVDQAPDLVTMEFKKAERGGRVFLDVGRNAPGAHVASVYSPRARSGAPASFPIPWGELTSARPGDFTIRSAPGVVERRGDLWADLMPAPQRLPSSLGRSR
jgi:bifunctional non-homologous end joining protein LigD